MAELTRVEYTTMLASLEAKRAQLDAAIAAIRELAGMVPEQMPYTTESTLFSTAPARSPEAAYAGMSVVKAAEAYLRAIGKPQSAPEIARAIKRGGVKSEAGNFPSAVYTRLHRAAQRGTSIIKVGKSFGLPEWNRKDVLRTVS